MVRELADVYPDSVHVRDVGLLGAVDQAVWAYAAQQGLLLTSKDTDFYQRSMVVAAPSKVVWLRVSDVSTAAIAALLRQRDVPAWRGERALGSIAGSRGVGLGRFLARLDRPHDGTVAAVETTCVAAADQIVLPVSHFGGLFSREVANQVIYFLRRGRFRRGGTSDGCR